MIRAIRKRHKMIWIALAVILPLLIAIGLTMRHSEPVSEGVPGVNVNSKTQ